LKARQIWDGINAGLAQCERSVENMELPKMYHGNTGHHTGERGSLNGISGGISYGRSLPILPTFNHRKASGSSRWKQLRDGLRS